MLKTFVIAFVASTAFAGLLTAPSAAPNCKRCTVSATCTSAGREAAG
jgi:hypothetical protein